MGCEPGAVSPREARIRRAHLVGPGQRVLQIGLSPRHHATGGVLPAPTGLMVLEADLYFADETRMTEASLVVLAEEGRDAGMAVLVRELGRPAFRAELPGYGDVVLGWRAGRTLAMARFTDLDVIHLTISLDQPEDAIAGPSVLLFEGLMEYATRRARLGASAQLEIQVRQLLDWVELARSSVRTR